MAEYFEYREQEEGSIDVHSTNNEYEGLISSVYYLYVLSQCSFHGKNEGEGKRADLI